jgi:FkbM family methyltransferase
MRTGRTSIYLRNMNFFSRLKAVIYSILGSQVLKRDLNLFSDLLSASRLDVQASYSDEVRITRSILNEILNFTLEMKPQLLAHTQSQRLQEIFFFSLFNGQLGSFIEAGANNGVLYSNTYGLYRTHSSFGVCIEPNPRIFNSLVSNRPNDISLMCALSDRSGDSLRFVSNSDSGLYARDPKVRYSSHDTCTDDEFIARSMTIPEVLQNADLQEVDFLSLDIEGGEYRALMGLDRQCFLTACIEVNTRTSFGRVRQRLQALGYRTFRFPFANNEILAISSRAQLNETMLAFLNKNFRV